MECRKVNIESLFNALYTKGYAKLSDHSTPVKNWMEDEDEKPKKPRFNLDKNSDEDE